MGTNERLALEVVGLTAGYQGKIVLEDVSWKVSRGSLAAIIGPNGGGKSTFLKTIVGLLRPMEYSKLHLVGLPPKQGRKKTAYLPQQEEVDWSFPITVLDVVLQGRLVSQGLFGRYSTRDYDLSLEALDLLGMSKFAHTQIGSLSGGQRQRVFLARALVQEADVILLDEPSTGLDAKAQHELAEIFRDLGDAGKTIIAATHDINCLTECFDQILALDGQVLTEGTPNEVLTEANMVQLFARHFPKISASGEVTVHEP
ncbi:MAG: ABC transporter ATP-binding protein [Firmicutes bacterium]|nr:ABC transporter ATP-binding protein [Bacillota bacterium]